MIVDLNFPGSFEKDGWQIHLNHHPDDHKDVLRLKIISPQWTVELFPTKGLSIGQAIFKNAPIFWDAPTGLIHPDTFDPNEADVLINGKPAPGFSFLKTFASGIELYGLKNWGMPVTDEKGHLLPLHGETSNIPVDEASIIFENDGLNITAAFVYRTFEGETNIPWYKRGKPLFKIVRTIQIYDTGIMALNDTIENISTVDLVPDWGYHITFYALNGASLLIPSALASARGGGHLPPDIETWHAATDDAIRTEVGIIHKGLKPFENGNEIRNKCLVTYPNRDALIVSFTPAPYMQTWFCNGGTHSTEFTYDDGDPVFKKPWNGLGMEIGASALDHDGNIDSRVVYNKTLQPGEKKIIHIMIEVAAPEQAMRIESEIKNYQKQTRLQ